MEEQTNEAVNTPVDTKQDHPSKTEQVYGKQASGFKELDKDDLDPLTNRPKTGVSGEKPETNLKNMREDGAKPMPTFMAVIPPDQNDPQVKKMNEAKEELRKEADKNSEVQPKMGSGDSDKK